MLLLIGFLVVTSHCNPIIRVDQEYPRNAPVSSWITIALAQPVSTIKSVMWCKSIMANPKAEGDRVPPLLKDCQGKGLTHLELYPKHVRIPNDEPNTIYIDPEEIGGWDTTHQFNIIVSAHVKERSVELMQVVRFNPALPAGTAGTSAIQGPVEHSVPAVPAGTAGTTDANSIPIISVVPSVPEGTEGTPEPPIHPWLSMGMIFGFGLLLLSTLGLAAYAKKRHRPFNQMSSLDRLPSMSEDEEDGIEMLMKMGKGADPAFEQNL